MRVFPFMPGGAADNTPLPIGAVVLTDLSGMPRFGLKGAGSADWLNAKGISLPAVNRIASHRGMRVLRLGNDDIVLLAEENGQALTEVVSAWHADTGPKGYSSWREEGWAWMRLSGPRVGEVMSRLCALDLRPERFAPDEIAQTRLAGLEAVLFRSETGFDVLFDITASAFFARAVAAVATQSAEAEMERHT
jgi:sarcosine oxidase subunit gamma